ncbi:uncharacterized protein JCM10292_003132 [Rhodotorula paludigena]|uniref:uncharacterized protein n=1 Tax=Rhodotorula paludigena TaxID=86838 RepID=UPI0031784339
MAPPSLQELRELDLRFPPQDPPLVPLLPPSAAKHPRILPSLDLRDSSSFRDGWRCDTYIVPAAFPRMQRSASRHPGEPSPVAHHPASRERPCYYSMLGEMLRVQATEPIADPEAERETVEEQEQLYLAVNRYVPVEPPRREGALSLVMSHGNGMHKETWEPVLDALLSDLEGSSVEVAEAWALDCVCSGDSALLNEEVVGRGSNWLDYSRDLLNFLVSYIDSPSLGRSDAVAAPLILRPSTLDPALLSLDSRSEPPAGHSLARHRTFRRKTIVGVGHSFGASTLALAATAMPFVFSSLWIFDPWILPRAYNLSIVDGRFFKSVAMRKDSWTSRKEACETLTQKGFFKVWDRRIVELFLRHGLRDLPDGRVGLRTTAKTEALVYANPFGWQGHTLFTRLRRLDPSLPIRYVVPSRGQSIVDDELLDEALDLLPWLDVQRLSKASHLLPQIQPDRAGTLVGEWLKETYGREAAARPKLDFTPPPSALLQSLYGATTRSARTSAASSLAGHVVSTGVRSLVADNILDDLTRAAKGKSPQEKEGAMVAFDEIFRKAGLSLGAVDPYFVPLLPVILDQYQESGKTGSIKDAAEKAAKQLQRLPPPELAPRMIEELFTYLESNAKWRSKVGALELLGMFAVTAKDQVAERLGDYVPRLVPSMRDTKSEISSTAEKIGVALCQVLTNPDIQPFVTDLVRCMADPTTVPAAIKRLSSTVWVREIDGPTLAVVSPLLTRALAEKGNIVQRQTVVLTTNLFKLVRSPDLAASHADAVLPGIERIIESAAFPEIRAFAEEAKRAVQKSVQGASIPAIDHLTEALGDERTAYAQLMEAVEQQTGDKVDAFAEQSIKSAAFAIAQLVRKRQLSEKEWKDQYVAPYVAHFVGQEASEKIALDLLAKWVAVDKERNRVEGADDDDDEEGEILIDLPFSLAYGGLLLLNHTALKLRKGHRYGICGANGCGKSTLLKAINRKQIDNFPTDIKAAYVEHDIEGDETGITVCQLMIDEPRISATEAEIRSMLEEMGFAPERQDVAINSLSGGWKMRVALCRAMLMKVDLLLLDEPTNHLDVQSVAWLQDYLNSQDRVTSMIISHDSGFLDAVCSNIIHYHKKQLVYYRGNLAKFVEKYPPGKTYYTLSDEVVKFTFPPPGSLMGVRSRTRAILKMSDCTFTYPGASKPQLYNASCAISLSSRVGVVGPNGAGKSTLIKLLTGETLPDSGRVEKHPNLRIAYVAQHAFHHIEQHLEKSAVQYIMWRYQEGVDKEQAHKATRALTEAEQAQLKVPFVAKTGESRFLEQIVGRQKLKKSYAYEIKWQGMQHKHNTFVPRERLIELGFSKLVQEFDDFEASREGAGSREMSVKLVRQHLEGVGLDGDIAEYNEMRGLSGGQKVKVVIAAAMWSKPQALVLDEPTNFLDRDALGGLAVGIREWTGAFICISHNQEFVGALCGEIWNVEAGRLTIKGKAAVDDNAFESNPNSARETPAATPGAATPASAETPVGSGDEARAAATIEGADQELKFKAAKGRKKLTRKQLKEREDRRRARTLAFLSNTTPGAVREPDTEDEDEEHEKQVLKIPSKRAKSGTTTPTIAGVKKAGTVTPA